jgi:Fe-S oxidoreductase/nitrate reductase gamma subunit
MTPTREIYWNITAIWLMYALLIPTLLAFGYGIYRHYRRWRLGKPENRFVPVLERIQGLFVYAFGQARLLRNRYAGLFHSLIFFGFFILFIGTVVVMIHEDLGLRIMQGNFYLFFQSLTLDVFGLFCILGVLIALYHRYVSRPRRLHNTWQDPIILAWLLAILLTGFMVEGLRIAVTQDPWGSWSPVGLVVGALLTSIIPADVSRLLHVFLWWGHLLLVFGFIAWLPYSKLLHVLTAPANIYFRSLDAKGAMLKPIDMGSAESFGVKTIGQFTWKALLDLDACTECGRCQDACPAFAAGKPLSPKSLILDLREHLREKVNGSRAPGAEKDADDKNQLLVGNVIQEETLWSCTTCMACMQECPVFIEHVPKIVEMRRYAVMEESRFPETMQRALRSLEARGHPYPGTVVSRTDWCRGMDIKILANAGPVDYLYWVGCTTALHARNQKTAQSFSRLLQRAGVNFAILGDQEHCTGDPARRIGNEYLFDKLARRNIKTLQSYKVKRIVTTCPHCLNTLKNEYPKFGAEFEVTHHSQLLAELLKQGRLKPSGGLEKKVTFHDPCYLGRYNDTYEEPREVISAVAKEPLTEMRQNRERSFCCGAGGGLMWMEEPNDKRVSNIRAEHAVQSGAAIVGVACPFCMIMLGDGIKNKGGEQAPDVLDIAELLDGTGNGKPA